VRKILLCYLYHLSVTAVKSVSPSIHRRETVHSSFPYRHLVSCNNWSSHKITGKGHKKLLSKKYWRKSFIVSEIFHENQETFPKSGKGDYSFQLIVKCIFFVWTSGIKHILCHSLIHRSLSLSHPSAWETEKQRTNCQTFIITSQQQVLLMTFLRGDLIPRSDCIARRRQKNFLSLLLSRSHKSVTILTWGGVSWTCWRNVPVRANYLLEVTMRRSRIKSSSLSPSKQNNSDSKTSEDNLQDYILQIEKRQQEEQNHHHNHNCRTMNTQSVNSSSPSPLSSPSRSSSSSSDTITVTHSPKSVAQSSPLAPSSTIKDLYSQLEQKEKDLILAAELGKALLERNEELTRANERITEDYSAKLEVRKETFSPFFNSLFSQVIIMCDVCNLGGDCACLSFKGEKLDARWGVCHF